MENFLNSNLLMPSEGSLNIAPGMPSLFGSAFAMDKANVLSQVINSQMQDYQQARPSALERVIAENQAVANTVGRLKEGEADRSFAQGKYEMGVLPSRIQDAIDSHDEKKRERGYKSIQHGLRTLDLIGPAVERGDYELADRLFTTAGSPEAREIFEHIKQSESPYEALQYWRQSLESAEARGKAGEIKLKGGFDVREREIMADAQKFSAYMQYLSAQFRTNSQKARDKVEGLLSRTMEEWFKETDPKKATELYQKVDIMNRMLLGWKVAGAPMSGAELGAGVLGGQQAPNAPGAPAARLDAFPPVPPLPGQNPAPPRPTQTITKEQVEAAGERYQPDLYEYSMINGRLMKRRKTGG